MKRCARYLAGVGLGLAGLACAAEPAPPATAPARGTIVSLAGETLGHEPRAFAALAGNWKVTDDGGPVVMVDGRAWKAGTPPNALTTKAEQLFASAAPAFANRVLGALQYPFAVARDVPSFGDGEISVEFKLVGGASDQFASILFGLTDQADYLALRYNTKDHDVALWRVKDGERERLHHGGTEVVIPMGEWHALRLKVQGTAVDGWVDQTKALTFALPGPAPGRVGLWSKPDSVTAYRNFTVRRD